MAAQYHLVKVKDFLHGIHSGKPDYEEAMQLLLHLSKLAAPPADYHIMIDMSGTRGLLSLGEVLRLINVVFRTYADSFQNKVAMVHSPTDYDRQKRARMIKDILKHHGIEMNVFTSQDAAVRWFQDVTEMEAD